MYTIFLTVFCDLAPRSFFPGRSFFFWLLIAMGFYLFYLYSNSKNKKDFIKSPYILSVSIALLVFFSAYLSINTFLTDPLKKYEVEEKKIGVSEILKEEQKIFEETEKNFTNSELHYRLIKKHFELPSTWTGEYAEFREREELSLFNFYSDKLETLSDPHYLNNARLGLGLLYYFKGDLPMAANNLNNISDAHFPILNFYKGKISLDQKDTLKAIAFFKKGSNVKDVFQNESSTNLILLLDARNDIDQLYLLLDQDKYKYFFTYSLATKIYFLKNRIVAYYSLMLSRVFHDFKWTGFIAALVILITWGVFIVRMDIFEQENKLIMMLVLFTGMAFSLGCFYLYDYLHYVLNFYKNDHMFLYCIFGIGFVEELMKIIPLLLLLLIAPKVVNEPYDYILYASLSALGFSFMENLMYFDGNLNNVVHGRGLTSVPGHIIFSSFVAYGLILAKYRYKKVVSIVVIPVFFLFGMIAHGLYDYWIFANLNLLFIVGFILSVSFWIIIINNSLNNSPSFSYHIASQPHSRQLILSLSLLSILVLEYIVVAWERGPLFANSEFNGNLFFWRTNNYLLFWQIK